MLFSSPFSPSLGIGRFDSKFNGDAQSRAALTLSQVSRRWRTIAKSTHELWSVFSASISRNERSRPLEWGPEWLKRSGNSPLYIELRFLLAHHQAETSLAEKLVDQLCLHAARWKVIRLNVAYKCIPWFSSALAEKKLTILDDIHVSFTRSRSGKPSLEIDASPKSITTELHANNILVDWTNLCHCAASSSGGRMSRRDFIKLLARSHNILSCSFEGDVPSPSRRSVSMINHSSLHTLKISLFPSNLWDTITLPSLKIMHLHPYRDSLS
ncbi:hypothetical protein CPB83DRAFT_171778 [Crepidotus variabilis]|uniref:F-box domain-containing protein n=1 Tax=Crepidotus variabilis TaxID=179855 RepID=A0A9P6JRV6_9AGAR|nr:hypothetical protein CPB83DRAFT_171778 [Crepidotus variabilis]